MGVRNLADFGKRLDKYAVDVERRGILFQKKVAFMVLGAFLSTDSGIRAHVGLLQLTPVDTGRAVGNYTVSVSTPDLTTVEGDFGRAGGGEANRSRAEARVQTAGVRALSGLRLGESVFICNSLPYIGVLNDGATNRTAHHMLERSLSNTRAALKAGA